MAKSPKLKVFRTPIGFHDAYVAAPSRKAALAAWGSTADLFARGVAEEVTDPDLTAEPLARPGEVIRRSRGTAAEQLAALPPDPPRAKKAPGPAPAKPAATPKPKPPRPDRADLDAAEQALEEAEGRHKAVLRDVAEREAALAKEKRDLTRSQAAEAATLEQARDDARIAYDRALKNWRDA